MSLAGSKRGFRHDHSPPRSIVSRKSASSDALEEASKQRELDILGRPFTDFDAETELAGDADAGASSGDEAEEDVDEHSVASEGSVGGAYHLPLEIPAPRRELFRDFLYARLTMGHTGPAKLYVATHSSRVKTSKDKPDDVWSFNQKTCLWELLPFKSWKHRVTDWCSRALALVKPLIKEYMDQYADEKELAKPWKAAHARVMSALTMFNSGSGAVYLARHAHELLLEEGFAETLDNLPLHMSFENGVLDLKTLFLTPRNLEHRLSYTLPYAWDADADTSEAQKFFFNVFEDDLTTRSMQNLCGYFFTGDVKRKALYEMVSPPDGAKSSILQVLQAAGGAYVRLNKISLAELIMHGSNFQDDLHAQLCETKPYPRLVCNDETDKPIAWRASIMAVLTDGLPRKALTFARKHMKGASMTVEFPMHAKFLAASNFPPIVDSASVGMARRKAVIDIQLTFKKDFDPLTALEHERRPDPELRDKLLSIEGRPGLCRWILIGAQRYLLTNGLGEGSPTCPRFEDATNRLRVKGDPCLEWLRESYSITKDPAHFLLVEQVVQEFRTSGRLGILGNGRAAESKAFDSFKTILDNLKGQIHEETRADFFGNAQKGYSGIAKRRPGDPGWTQ